jgi:hypothetical protein
VKHLAHIGAAGDQRSTCRHDVGHDEIESLRRTGCGRGDALTEVDRGRRTRRRKLHDPELVSFGEVGIEPPAEASVELLGAVDVRDRNDDHLELQVDRTRAGGPDCCLGGLFALTGRCDV